MKKFHKSLKFQIYHCCVCHEAWPLNTKPKNTVGYTCSCFLRDKNVPKKFLIANSAIRSRSKRVTRLNSVWRDAYCKSISCNACIYKTKRWPNGIQRACYYLATGCTTACRYTAQVPLRFACHYFYHQWAG